MRARADLTPAQIVERLSTIAPETVRGRTRTPAFIRDHAKLAIDGPVHETWKLGYLIDTIYPRDPWMHRVDAARALGRLLELAGPASGTYGCTPPRAEAEVEVEHVTLDAVELCRTLAGRNEASGLLETIVPF